LNLRLSFAFAVTISEVLSIVVAGIREKRGGSQRRRFAHAERRIATSRTRIAAAAIAKSRYRLAVLQSPRLDEKGSRVRSPGSVARSSERDNTATNRVIKMRTLDEKLTVRERGLQLESTRPERENV